MSNQTNPGADIVADAREWLANHADRVTTHGDECHRWHDACLILRLVDECDRLRNAALEYTPGVSAGSESKPARTAGAVNGPPDCRTGCGECSRIIADCDRLREAVRRLADQDATLSVQGGNVTVTVDATLTDAEREAVGSCIADDEAATAYQRAATLRALLDRTLPPAT